MTKQFDLAEFEAFPMFDPKDEGQRSVFYEGLIRGSVGVAASTGGRSAGLRPEPLRVSSLRAAPTNARKEGR
jgi:hypothetical protein